jgi:hypothetical protein
MATQRAVAPSIDARRALPGGDVIILRWPEQRDEVERLEEQHVPRLLLVDPDVAPPDSDSCLEDWVRLPAEDSDVRARLMSLARRAAHHPSRPHLDDLGQLTHRGARLFLSPLDQRIVRVLLERYQDVVLEDDLLAAWPEGGANGTLRVHLSRLRRRLEPLGLTITSVRTIGYSLSPTGI